MKSCDQNDETFWSHDYTKFKFRSIKRLAAFAIPVSDVDSLVILVINKFKYNNLIIILNRGLLKAQNSIFLFRFTCPLNEVYAVIRSVASPTI